MKNICVIPARGGSKRIKKKNIKLLDGEPLISYSIKAALESNRFEKIIVSTEDKEISELSIKMGVTVDKRPDHLCGDSITKIKVVEDIVKRLKLDMQFDNIAALLPTCPFRTSKDIINAVELFKNNDLEFLIGVTNYSFPIQLALNKNENIVEMIEESSYLNTRSQDIDKKYHPNGAIYMSSMKGFLRNKSFFNKKMICYYMSPISSFDIDYPYQFEIAEILAKKIKNNEL